MSEAKVVRLVIEYDDGKVEFAEGDAANQIMQWYRGAESLACLHGAIYKGPKFQALMPEDLAQESSP